MVVMVIDLPDYGVVFLRRQVWSTTKRNKDQNQEASLAGCGKSHRLCISEGAQGFSPAKNPTNIKGFSPGLSFRKPQPSFFPSRFNPHY
jgi:hypothetical protein